MTSKLFAYEPKCDGVIPHTNNQFVIDLHGNINSTVSGKVINSYLSNDELYVDLPIHLTGNAWTSKSVKLAVISSIVYKGYSLPLGLWNDIELFYKDGNVFNVHPSNIAHKRYNDRFIEHFANDETVYKIVPNYTKYAINKNGVVRRRFDGAISSESKFTSGYVSINLRPDIHSKSNGRRHRLLALAYLDYPINVDDLDVNHLDSVPGNDSLDNLEWATRTRNNLHAVKSGRKSQAKRVISYNVITGAATIFPAINDAARSYGLNVGSVWSSIKHNTDVTVSKPCHLYKTIDDVSIDSIAWNVPKLTRSRFELLSSVLVWEIGSDHDPKLFGSAPSAAKYISDSSPELGFKDIKAVLNIKFDYGKPKVIGKWLARRVILVNNEVSVISGDV